MKLVIEYFSIINNSKNNLDSIRIQFKPDLNPIQNPVNPNLIRL